MILIELAAKLSEASLTLILKSPTIIPLDSFKTGDRKSVNSFKNGPFRPGGHDPHSSARFPSGTKSPSSLIK